MDEHKSLSSRRPAASGLPSYPLPLPHPTQPLSPDFTNHSPGLSSGGSMGSDHTGATQASGQQPKIGVQYDYHGYAGAQNGGSHSSGESNGHGNGTIDASGHGATSHGGIYNSLHSNAPGSMNLGLDTSSHMLNAIVKQHTSWAPSSTPSHFNMTSNNAPGSSGRGSSYIHHSDPNLHYSPRTAHSPSTETGPLPLPVPPYDQVPHPFQTSTSGSAASHALPSTLDQSLHHNTGTYITPQSHGRPSIGSQSYYTTNNQHSNYTPYAQPSAAVPQSATTSASTYRGIGAYAGQLGQTNMTAPGHYRTQPNAFSASAQYSAYPHMPGMAGTVMSNIHQPGSQMSMLPGMNMGPGYGAHHSTLYTEQVPAPVERPFKCEQCSQSFSRNHDLKRHKRIHLAVKPFPCNYCSKSFSRKDALKRHRLVKGCGRSNDVRSDVNDQLNKLNSNEGSADKN